MEPVFLSLDEVLEIHEQQIERYGGSSGIRDVAGLESAVATPQATFGGEFLHSGVSFSPLPEPRVYRRQQTSGSKRRDHIPADEQLGANSRRGRTRGAGSVGCLKNLKQTAVDRDLRIPLQASRRCWKPRSVKLAASSRLVQTGEPNFPPCLFPPALTYAV
jgi:hypothetical protein